MKPQQDRQHRPDPGVCQELHGQQYTGPGGLKLPGNGIQLLPTCREPWSDWGRERGGGTGVVTWL